MNSETIENNTDTVLMPTEASSPNEDYARAVFLTQRITSNIMSFCWDLKEMRDRKLFLKLGYESFADYLKNTLPTFVSLSFARNLLLLSEKMSQQEYTGMGQEQVQALAKIASDSDVFKISGGGEVHLLNGTIISVEDYESIRAEEIAQKTKTYSEALTLVEAHKKLQKENKKIGRDLELSEKQIGTQNEELKKLRTALDYIGTEKNIDTDIITTITTKLGASKHITDLFIQLEHAITVLNSIDESLKADMDIASLVLQFESLLKVSVTKLNAAWNPHFFALQDHDSED